MKSSFTTEGLQTSGIPRVTKWINPGRAIADICHIYGKNGQLVMAIDAIIVLSQNLVIFTSS